MASERVSLKAETAYVARPERLREKRVKKNWLLGRW